VTDRAIPNLPARDVDATVAFYGGFGFTVAYRSDEWLILRRGDLQLEFFPAPDVDPLSSSFMCTVRVADLDALHAAIAATGIPQMTTGHPRLTPIERRPWGMRAAYLVDLDGTQLSLVEDAS
jgi:catechol 2,3-dioxygenase-like lactoylglutathione lyase family enzyme